jgi:hypothetical protein
MRAADEVDVVGDLEASGVEHLGLPPAPPRSRFATVTPMYWAPGWTPGAGFVALKNGGSGRSFSVLLIVTCSELSVDADSTWLCPRRASAIGCSGSCG